MKSISPGTVTIGVLAIVCGLVGVYVARRAMTPDEVPDVRPAPIVRATPGPAVIYARVNLPAKTRITLRDLRERRLKQGEERPAGSVGSEAELVGRITREPIRANSVMLDDLLYDVGEGPDPTALIPAGHVAVAITATGNRASKDLIRMGSRVNVSGTYESDDLELGLVSTTTILENALVIATGPDDFERLSPTLSPRDPAQLNRNRQAEDQITLAVTQNEADRLVTAQKSGSLSVTLVGFDGPSVGDGTVVKTTDIWPFPPEVVPTTTISHEVIPPAPPSTYKVERWNGSSMEIIELPNRAVIEARNATIADQTRSDGTVPVNIRTPQ